MRLISYKSVLLFVLLLTRQWVFAQHVQNRSQYKVLHISGDVKISKESINTELSKIDRKNRLESFLRKKFNQPENVKLLFSERNQNGTLSYFTYENVKLKMLAVSNIAVMAGKNIESNEIQKQDDFAVVLSDTLVVLDTLQLRLELSDSNCDIKNYKMIYDNPETATLEKINLRHSGYSIWLTGSDYPNDAAFSFHKSSLRNFDDPQTNLAITLLRFLTPRELSDLKSQMISYRESFPETTNTETKFFARSLVQNLFGHANSFNVDAFLLNNNLISVE